MRFATLLLLAICFVLATAAYCQDVPETISTTIRLYNVAGRKTPITALGFAGFPMNATAALSADSKQIQLKVETITDEETIVVNGGDNTLPMMSQAVSIPEGHSAFLHFELDGAPMPCLVTPKRIEKKPEQPGAVEQNW